MQTLQQTLTKNQIEIIKAVLYFDIFHHPLTRKELFENAAISMSQQNFTGELEFLLNNDLVKEESGYILSIGGSSNDITKRHTGNKGASAIMPTALKYSRLIASFPFVEGVYLSGGLSKNYYDEKSDIDFFIITKPNRLWICRTLLIIRYKLLPKSKKKFWCVNYFISSDSLFIPDNNPFSGTELAHLIPTVNYELYLSLLKENDWYKSRFPNKPQIANVNCIETPKPIIKLAIEKILGGIFGSWMDDLLLRITLKHWQKKYPKLSEENFELQFRSRKSVCKRHTHGFQNKVLQQWNEKQNEYKKLFNISFD